MTATLHCSAGPWQFELYISGLKCQPYRHEGQVIGSPVSTGETADSEGAVIGLL